MPTGSAATPIVVSIVRLSKYSFTNAARVTFDAHDAAASVPSPNVPASVVAPPSLACVARGVRARGRAVAAARARRPIDAAVGVVSQ